MSDLVTLTDEAGRIKPKRDGMLPRSILEDAEQIYKGEREQAGNQQTAQISSLGTAKVDSTGKTVNATSVLDPYNIFGARAKRIQELISDPTTRSVLMEGRDGQGKYGGLSWVDRSIHKISDEDITKALHRDSIKRRGNNEQFQEALDDLTPEQRANVTSLTAMTKVFEQAKDNNDYKDLEKTVRGMDLGAISLDELVKRNDGKAISIEDLRQLETDLKPLQKAAIQKDRQIESQLQTEETSRNVSQQNASTQAGTLELNRTIAANNQTLQLAKLAHADKVAQQEREIANIKIRNQERTANADRELRRDLAMLTRQDNADERAYRRGRDERESRQLMIMQLMKGLSQMGQSFAI